MGRPKVSFSGCTSSQFEQEPPTFECSALHSSDNATAVLLLQARPQRVRVAVDEISAVSNTLAAQISPERRMPFDLTEMPPPRRATCCDDVDEAPIAREAGRSPVYRVTVVMVRHGDRISEVLAE